LYKLQFISSEYDVEVFQLKARATSRSLRVVVACGLEVVTASLWEPTYVAWAIQPFSRAIEVCDVQPSVTCLYASLRRRKTQRDRTRVLPAARLGLREIQHRYLLITPKLAEASSKASRFSKTEASAQSLGFAKYTIPHRHRLSGRESTQLEEARSRTHPRRHLMPLENFGRRLAFGERTESGGRPALRRRKAAICATYLRDFGRLISRTFALCMV
jgi:hypothetical protein